MTNTVSLFELENPIDFVCGFDREKNFIRTFEKLDNVVYNFIKVLYYDKVVCIEETDSYGIVLHHIWDGNCKSLWKEYYIYDRDKLIRKRFPQRILN